MKIINVPYSRNVQSVVDIVILAFAMSGIIIMILSIFQLDWKTFLVSSLITIPTSVFLWKEMTLQILIWTKDFISINSISDIDSKGFTINNNQKSLRLDWDEIKYFKLDQNSNLLIEQNKGKQIKIEKDYFFWYALLQKTPSSKLINSQIPDYLNRIFEDLKTCPVCGKIALGQEKCLSCKSLTFNNELKEEFANEYEYIKDEQLELFCTDDKHEIVNFYLDDDDGFEIDKRWKPIISEKDVIEYSKENYWD